MATQQTTSYYKMNNHSPCTASCVTLSPEVLGLESRCPNKQKKKCMLKIYKNAYNKKY